MGAFGTGTFGTGTFGIGGAAAPPVTVGYVAFEMFENVGVASTPSGSPIFEMYDNVGVQTTMVKEPLTEMYENVGFELPHTVALDQPQMGWGVPVTPKRTTTLLSESAQPSFAMYENVT